MSDLESLLRQGLQELVYGPVSPIVLLLAVALGAAITAYVSPYLRRRGENYATKQDLDMLLEQLRSTTRVAEEVRAEVSGGVWLDQNRWELKKVYYESLLKDLHEAVQLAGAVWEGEQRRGTSETEEQERVRDKFFEQLWERAGKASERVRLTIGPARLFLNDNAVTALNKYLTEAAMAKDTDNWNQHVFLVLNSVEKAYEEVLKVARRDLRLVPSINED